MIWIGIPTGQRAKQAVEVAKTWKSRGFKVCAYCWDDETYNGMDMIADMRIKGDRQSFAKLQNLMARTIPDWDLYICGADDLWPDKDVELLFKLNGEAVGKIVHIFDGFQKYLPTHPVISRVWWANHNQRIFDEGFYHNFCDTDLYYRAIKKDEIVSMPQVSFDHRHPITGKSKTDEVYRLGSIHFAKDKAYFYMKHGSEIEKGTPKEVDKIYIQEKNEK